MKVAVAYEAGQPLTVEDLDLPVVGPRDVLVRIAASGICHTDVTVINGLSELPLPIVPGHEACGVVEQIGPDVQRLAVGDRVLASVNPACGTCWWCRNGLSEHCERSIEAMVKPRFRLGHGGTATALCGVGSFAEAMVVDESSVVPVQTDLPDEQLSLLGCGVTTGVGAALFTAGIQPGSTVAVIGCGGVGQSVIQGAAIAGAARIIAVDLSSSRRATALKMGATHAVDPAVGDPIQQVRDLADGRGADYSFEVVGQPDLMVQAYEMARPGGTVTLVGMPAATATLSLPAVSAVFSGKRLLGSVTGNAQILRDFPRLIRLAEAGRIDLGSMVSSRIGLDEVNLGIAALNQAEGIRTVIV